MDMCLPSQSALLSLFLLSCSSCRGVAVEMTEPLYDSPPLSAEELGDIGFLQNLPSILTSHVLDPQPGDTVLDMCASPGYHSRALTYTPTPTPTYACTHPHTHTHTHTPTHTPTHPHTHTHTHTPTHTHTQPMTNTYGDGRQRIAARVNSSNSVKECSFRV